MKKNTTIYINIAIPIFSAILGFSGAMLGTLFSAEKSEELWQKQERLTQIKTIINKRVELIERVSKLANSAPKMKDYQSYVDLQAVIAQEYIQCKQRKLSKCVEPDTPKDVLTISVKRAEMNGEFASTVQLVSLYFSDDTKKYANELGTTQQWWVNGDQIFLQLISSMHDELKNVE